MTEVKAPPTGAGMLQVKRFPNPITEQPVGLGAPVSAPRCTGRVFNRSADLATTSTLGCRQQQTSTSDGPAGSSESEPLSLAPTIRLLALRWPTLDVLSPDTAGGNATDAEEKTHENTRKWFRGIPKDFRGPHAVALGFIIVIVVVVVGSFHPALTLGSSRQRSRLSSRWPPPAAEPARGPTLPSASWRRRARSTRASVGLSMMDGVRLGGPEFDSDVTRIFPLSDTLNGFFVLRLPAKIAAPRAHSLVSAFLRLTHATASILGMNLWSVLMLSNNSCCFVASLLRAALRPRKANGHRLAAEKQQPPQHDTISSTTRQKATAGGAHWNASRCLTTPQQLWMGPLAAYHNTQHTIRTILPSTLASNG
uniref:Uncharacterized protein n=1 Tax=Anopheles atroparvus TaxID=41427 RepID=A0A182IK63_ANOAO